MSRQRTRSERIRRQKLGGFIALLIGGAVILGLVAVYLSLRREGLDARGCAVSGPSSLTVVIVDSTDSLTAVQRLALNNELVKVINAIPDGGALQFWRVAPNASALPAAAADILCNPGKTVNQWTGNPAKVEARYHELFQRPNETLAKRLTEGQSESASPIMETIQAVGLQVFDSPHFKAAAQKRLIVASDLIQNSAAFNQLTSVGSFDAFRRSDLFLKLSAPLGSVDVDVLYLRRADSSQGKQHIEFWQEYFAASGASLAHLISITGLS